MTTAVLPSLQLTRREMHNINAPLLGGADMGADGIIGTDSLRYQRVMFDFQAQTLSVVPAEVPDFKAEPGTLSDGLSMSTRGTVGPAVIGTCPTICTCAFCWKICPTVTVCAFGLNA